MRVGGYYYYSIILSFMAGREKNDGSKVHTLLRMLRIAERRGVADEILDNSFQACWRRTGNSNDGLKVHTVATVIMLATPDLPTLVPLVEADICSTECHLPDLHHQFISLRYRERDFLVHIRWDCFFLHQPACTLGQHFPPTQTKRGQG